MDEQRRGGGLKAVLALAVIAFAVTLAVIIGRRMSAEAMAVVIGVACGVMASVPTSLLMLMATRRSQPPPQDEWRQPPPTAYPPVVVIQGGQAERLSVPQPGGTTTPWQGSRQRSFEIVGQEGEGDYFN